MGGQKKGLKTAFAEALVEEIEALIGNNAADGLDFEALETAARRQALGVAAKAIEQRLNADLSDHAGPTLRCACGRDASYAGRLSKTFQTALGEMTLARAYYHCAGCAAGCCPRDQALGLTGSSLSPALTRMVGMTAAMVSFQEASELMSDLAGVPVETKQVERTAEALGRDIARDEQTFAEPALPSKPTLYLGMDGTGVPMRAAEVAGRKGKQPDGSAKTREVKLVTVWSAESRNKAGLPTRDPGSVTYSAAIESAACRDSDETPSVFAGRVEREARRRGFEKAERRVVLGDGAPWIWNLTDELFPGAIQIVDLYHAKEHLSIVAKAIYGQGSQLCAHWEKLRHAELDRGDIAALLRALDEHAGACPEARKCGEYIAHNRRRMNYPVFRAQGLCVGSGVVEAGCKVAIGTRLKRAGMHWTLAGANAIIALRCCKLSNRFENYWERQAAAAKSA